LFGPLALNAVVRRILQHVSSAFGPFSEADTSRLSPTTDGRQVLPFKLERGEPQQECHIKKGAVVRRIVVAFLRERMEVEVDLPTVQDIYVRTLGARG
jgi:hypothetical protein